MATPDNTTNDNVDGIWIGIDFGTTHCSVAVYDATRGGPKWIRLASAIPEKRKHGRIVPTQLVLPANTESKKHEPLFNDWKGTAIVGFPAWKQLHNAQSNDDESNDIYFIPNVKRNFAQAPQGCWDSSNDNQHSTSDSFKLKWVDAVALVIHQLRIEADAYIELQASKKHLQTPGQGLCRNVVLGVPARYTTAQRHGMIQAAKQAGFTGHISTVTESTAAAMAYGLFVGKRVVPSTISNDSRENDTTRILVFDMGGGTTDITVAVLHPPNRRDSPDPNTKHDDPSQRFQVETTRGDGQLGGDDMDEAILHYLLKQHHIKLSDDNPVHQRQFLRACQQAKEALTEDEQTEIQWQGSRIPLTRPEFDHCIAPLLQRARTVLHQALSSTAPIHEVVLIGGATRVPAVRAMLRETFPHIAELSTAVHPVSAVAQGCAIQAAWLSHQIPQHALESALMLDTTPYALGVLRSLTSLIRGIPQQIIPFYPEQHVFLELIPRDSPLPAMGAMPFALSDPQQAGVTVLAVEYVPEEALFVVLNEFSFLLRRLKNERQERRQVEVGMRLTEQGQVMVSVFDANDPDHVRIRGKGNVVEDTVSMEQWCLGMGCVILFVLYVILKLQLSSGGIDVIAEEL